MSVALSATGKEDDIYCIIPFLFMGALFCVPVMLFQVMALRGRVVELESQVDAALARLAEQAEV